jgi:hypothetical protein
MSFFKTRSKYLQQLIHYQVQQKKPMLSFSIQETQNNIIIYYLYDYFFQQTIIPKNKFTGNIVWEQQELISKLDWNELFYISKNIITMIDFEDFNTFLKEKFIF